MTVTFEIPGPPIAKQRPRRGPAGHFFTPKRTQDYECTVAWAAKAAGLKLDPGCAYGLQIRFYLSTCRKDIDNCVKSIMDGLQRMGDGWNDAQVVSLVAMKYQVRDAHDERTIVSVAKRGGGDGDL